MNIWQERFIKLALEVADWSKDPATKVGAVIVDDKKRIVSVGYNGFPRGVHDNPERYEDREIKYKFVAHAERNALDNAFISVEGCTLYTTLYPCNECTKSIIQKGITTIVTPDYHNVSEKSQEVRGYKWSQIMLEESGIEVIMIDPDLITKKI
jgi:dCMP deaminase